MALSIAKCMINYNIYTIKLANPIESALYWEAWYKNMWHRLFRFCLIWKFEGHIWLRVKICLKVSRGFCPSWQNRGASVLRGFCPSGLLPAHPIFYRCGIKSPKIIGIFLSVSRTDKNLIVFTFSAFVVSRRVALSFDMRMSQKLRANALNAMKFLRLLVVSGTSFLSSFTSPLYFLHLSALLIYINAELSSLS